MVFGKIIKGYGSIFFGLLTFLLIALVCMAAGFAVTFPLWITATANKGVYTVLSVSVFSAGILYLLARKIVQAYKASPRRLFFCPYIWFFLFKKPPLPLFLRPFYSLTVFWPLFCPNPKTKRNEYPRTLFHLFILFVLCRPLASFCTSVPKNRKTRHNRSYLCAIQRRCFQCTESTGGR